MELDKLVFVKVLDNDAEEKKINVLMKNQAGENVIVRLFQPAFTSATIDQLIQRGIDRQQLILQNTKFSQWSTGLSSEFARFLFSCFCALFVNHMLTLFMLKSNFLFFIFIFHDTF